MYKFNPSDNIKSESPSIQPTKELKVPPAFVLPKVQPSTPPIEDSDKEKALMPYKAIKPLPIDKYKLKYCLQKYEKECQKMEFFWAVVGVLITLLLTKVSTNFHDAYGVPGSTWEGFFFFVAAAAFLYIIWFVLKFVWSFAIHRKTNDIQDIVKCVNSENPDD
jgi:hypothetical protein